MQVSLGAALAGTVTLTRLGAQRTNGTNVLFLMTDQQTFRALGAMGNKQIKTPNLDRLAREGVMFTHTVCTTPFCSPSRASIVTGLYPHKHGINRNVQRGQRGVTDDMVVTENILHDLGYSTHHRGKWHLGPTSDIRAYRDDQYDQREYNRMLNEKFPPEKAAAGKNEILLWGQPVIMRPFMRAAHDKWIKMRNIPKQDIAIIGRTTIPPEYMPCSWLFDQAIALLEQHAKERFMITCSVSPPHAFWVAPDPYYSMYDPDALKMPENFRSPVPEYYQNSVAARLSRLVGEAGLREFLRCYYAQVSLVDWNVGRILNKLRELGLERNTLVVFTSDHGDMNCGHGLLSKSIPACYDEIMRTPLLMRLPGKIPAGRVVDVHVNGVDIMPTILDYLGVPIPEGIHGRSLRPFIEGKPDDGAPGFSERTFGQGKNVGIQRTIRTKEWKYVYNTRWECELYNLREDPGETQNRINDRGCRNVLRELHGQLKQWMEKTGDPHIGLLKEPWA